MKTLAYFSAGVFVVVIIGLSREAFGESDNLILPILGMISGFAGIAFIDRLMPESHHHHDPCQDCVHSKSSAWRIVIADGIHNIADGLLLAGAFAFDVWVGVATTVGIVVHELAQEISEFFVLRGAGYSTTSALFMNAMSASTVFFGILLWQLLSGVQNIESFILALAGGAFLFIVVHDLLPGLIKSKNRPKTITAFVLGVVIMGVMGIFL